jgi:beta-glucuronidase
MLYPQNNEKRKTINLNGFWNFKTDPKNIGEKDQWYLGLKDFREISVPASWNEQYTDLYNYLGKGWYQTNIFIPSDYNEATWIRVGAVFYKAKIWINEFYIGELEGGSLPFEFDITKYTKKSQDNRITIMVDGTLDPWGLPQSLLNDENRVNSSPSYPRVNYDFFPYSGIHRPVVIYSTSYNRIEQIGITTSHTIIKNQIDAVVNFKVKTQKPIDGKVIVQCNNNEISIDINQKDIINNNLVLKDISLWDMDNPQMYDLVIRLFDNDNNLIDIYKQSFGIRDIKIVGDKFLLNDKKVFLKGFGKHEDLAIIGKGFNTSSIVKDFDLMHWIGANSLRTSHYPYSEEFLSYADRHGMLVIGETPFVGLQNRMYTKEVSKKANKTITKMIDRDKNHPCIIAWSVANEPVVSSDAGKKFFMQMSQTTKACDSTRPVMYCAHLGEADNVATEYFDLIGLNKYWGWYELPGEIDEGIKKLIIELDELHAAYKKPILLSEFGADSINGLHNIPSTMFSEEYQSELIEKTYNIVKDKPYILGTHVWCFADFMTAQGVTRVGMNRKGVFTRDRSPKMAAHKLKEMWSK